MLKIVQDADTESILDIYDLKSIDLLLRFIIITYNYYIDFASETSFNYFQHRYNTRPPQTPTRLELIRYAGAASFGFAPGLGLKDAKGLADNPGKVGPVDSCLLLLFWLSWFVLGPYMKTIENPSLSE